MKHPNPAPRARTPWGAICALLAVLLAPSIALAQLELVEPGEQSQALSGSSLWPSPVIRICWEDSAMSDAAAREWVREAAEGTWEAVSNVDFVGWEACTADDTTSVRVGRMDGQNRTFGLGTTLAGMSNGMQLTFDYVFPSGCAPSPQNTELQNEQIREACIRSNAVHEFGHALGFAHEHLRDDAGEICEAGRNNTTATEPEINFTEYDAESVMNYCASSAGTVNTALANGVELTPLDVAGVRVAYGPWDEGVFVSVAVEGYIEGRDNYFGGSERGERHFDVGLNVGNGTLATATEVMCLDSGNLQVQVDLAAEPIGEVALTLDADVTLFAGPGCGSAPVVDTASESFAVGIGPSGTLAQWQEFYLSAGVPSDTGHVRLMTYRRFDLDAALASCENCAELAENNAVPISSVGSPGFLDSGVPYIPTPWACLTLRGCDDSGVFDGRPSPISPVAGLVGGSREPNVGGQRAIPAAWLAHTTTAIGDGAVTVATETDASAPHEEAETLGGDGPVAVEPALPAYPIVVVSGSQKVKLAGVGKFRRESAFAFRIGEGWWDAVEPFGRALGGAWSARGKKGGSLRLRLEPQFEATLVELISEGLDGAIDAAEVSLQAPPKLQLKVHKDGTVASKIVVAFQAEIDGSVRVGKYVAKLAGEVR